MENRIADLSWRTERQQIAEALTDDDIFVVRSLRLEVPSANLVLRLPQTIDELIDAARVAASGIVKPGLRFFGVNWEKGEPADVARSSFSSNLGVLASIADADWKLPLCAYIDEQFVGRQSVRAENFAVGREFKTGSWVRPDLQSRGIGFAMRVAVLQLGFAEFDAETARSESFESNRASARVSEKCSYEPDGTETIVQDGHRLVGQRWLMTRDHWMSVRDGWPKVVVGGVTPQLLRSLGASETSDK
jgi:RimJ/RimL family protein N-acetyltransferase